MHPDGTINDDCVEEDQNNTSTSMQAARIMTWDENYILVTIVTVVGVGVIRAHL
jgi:hypothetical protein